MPTTGDVATFMRCQLFGKTILPNADFRGKTIMVTGANTGLGFEAAKHIARMHASTLILACRSQERGDAAAKQIRAVNSECDVQVWAPLDLDSYASVIAFCTRARNTLPRLDAIILNAGLAMVNYKTSESLERTITVNLVSNFMLAQGLLPVLRKTAEEKGVDVHLTIVGSMASTMAPNHELDVPEGKSILATLSDEKTADMTWRYFLSKTMVHLCLYAFAAGMPLPSAGQKGGAVIATVTNPAWCASNLDRDKEKISFGQRAAFAVMGRTTEEGGRALVHAITVDRDAHGKYLSECQVKSDYSYCRSEKGRLASERLWTEVSDIIQMAQRRA